MARRGASVVAGIGWLLLMPATGNVLLHGDESWVTTAFVPVAVLMAAVWWVHLRERRDRIGLAGGMAGWLFIGSVALLGVAGYLWMVVAMALVASALTYGLVLLVTQQTAPAPMRELITGLLLFSAAAGSAMLTLTSGMARTDVWWMPAHWLLAAGLAAASIVGAEASIVPDDAYGQR